MVDPIDLDPVAITIHPEGEHQGDNGHGPGQVSRRDPGAMHGRGPRPTDRVQADTLPAFFKAGVFCVVIETVSGFLAPLASKDRQSPGTVAALDFM